MKVGDLIKVAPCSRDKVDCECFFCVENSSRIGLVFAETVRDGSLAPSGWDTLFDCGTWEIFLSDIRHGNVEVVSEAS